MHSTGLQMLCNMTCLEVFYMTTYHRRLRICLPNVKLPILLWGITLSQKINVRNKTLKTVAVTNFNKVEAGTNISF